jgi:selenophosphate synthase
METRGDAGHVPFGGLLLQTVNFFPPIVDDPYRFGRIAAAIVGEVVEDAASGSRPRGPGLLCCSWCR